MKRRTLYYWSKLYESQINSGEPYNNLERTVTINILNFTYLQGNNRYHNAYVLKEKETNEVLTDLEEIHFIELTKFNEDQYKTIEDIEAKSKEDELIPWALFLKNPNSEVMNMYKEKIKELKEAAVKLEVLSHDEKTRELYEGRQKWIHDYVSNLEGTAREAREAGIKEGIKEGKNKRDIELAIKMLEKGMPVSEILDLVNIDKEKINLIKEEIKH